MRILILSDRYLPDTTGTALRISRLLRPIIEKNLCEEIHVATLSVYSSPELNKPMSIPRNELLDGVNIHRYSSEASLALNLLILQRKHKFNLVHARGIRLGLYAHQLSILSKIPYGIELNSLNPQKSRVRSLLWKNVLLSSDRLIVLTNFAKEWLNREFGIPKERIDVVVNGVDLNCFKISHEDRKNELGLNGNLVVGYTGTFLEWQGVFEFVRVAAVVCSEIPTIRFLMVGDGLDFERTCKLTEYYGIKDKFIFTGRIKAQEVPAYIQAMDVFLLARPKEYLKNEIASPLKLFEAMAMEKAVVVTRVHGLSEVVVDMKTGLVAGPSSHQIGAAVIKLLQDKELRIQLGNAARKQVEGTYSWTSSAECLFESYKKALSKK